MNGRQPGISVGVTLTELAEIMIDLGAVDAMNLDGGGSTTMVIRNQVLNLPSDGIERPVSNGIMIINPKVGSEGLYSMSMKKLLISGLLIWLILSSGVGATEVFPLDQVVPGMKGYGKTVVQGAKVEEFDFEVLDIIPQTPPIPSLIMIEVSGDLIERSDGIASGMSGSPVYLDGKLLGAIGYGYSYTNHRIGLVTPAESMMELINEVSDMDELPLPKDFEPLATPMLLGGFQNRAAKILEKQFAPHNLQVIPGLTGNSGSFENIMLEPGSAFGVQLLRGDFQVVAFGTITAITETGSFVGFGHPFPA